MKLEAERRLGQVLSVEIEGLWFLGAAASPALSALGRDDVYTVSLAHHF